MGVEEFGAFVGRTTNDKRQNMVSLRNKGGSRLPV